MDRCRVLRELRNGPPQINPSLLACDFGHLADEVHALEDTGVRVLHLDVMDGHFVPNLTYGPSVIRAIREATQLPLDAHLMISNPEKYLDDFADAGCDSLTFHWEAVANPLPLVDKIKRRGLLAGIALNPPTPAEALDDCIDACDLVLVMSVMPGFGGQSFEPSALAKLKHLRSRLASETLLSVDGGINEETIGDVVEAGAQLLVVGSAIFRSGDYPQAVSRLRRCFETRTHEATSRD
jgi:ribulose-phosphate 3-epimerase